MRRLYKIASLGGILLVVFLALPLQQAHASTRPPQQVSGHTILGLPTVSAAFINQVLAAYHSPAAGKGQALYNDGLASGIDPVYALAFFQHESSFGTAGVAQQTLSLGNLRCIPNVACLHGFAAFPTWEAGFTAWYQLIRSLYVQTWGLTTVEQIIPVYAPTSDNNNEAAYIAAVELAVDTWRNEQATSGTLPQGNSVPTPPTNALPVPPYPTDGYSILGKPTISVSFINHILTVYHSPAAGSGQVLYDTGVQYGIDPAFALAFFMHDSIFGTVGLARATHSLGPLPVPITADCQCQAFHGYRLYASWTDGIADWYRYVRHQYVDMLGLTTVDQIVPAYPLVKNPDAAIAFIQTVVHRVDVWRKARQPSTQN